MKRLIPDKTLPTISPPINAGREAAVLQSTKQIFALEFKIVGLDEIKAKRLQRLQRLQSTKLMTDD